MNTEKRLLPRFGLLNWTGVGDRRSPKPAMQRTVRTNVSSHVGLRTVALFEAAKGGIVVAAGLGVLELLGHDAQTSAEALVRHFHLNPASHYPRIFLLLAQQATPAHIWRSPRARWPTRPSDSSKRMGCGVDALGLNGSPF